MLFGLDWNQVGPTLIVAALFGVLAMLALPAKGEANADLRWLSVIALIIIGFVCAILLHGNVDWKIYALVLVWLAIGAMASGMVIAFYQLLHRFLAIWDGRLREMSARLIRLEDEVAHLRGELKKRVPLR